MTTTAAVARRKKLLTLVKAARRWTETRVGLFALCAAFTLAMMYHFIIPLGAIMYTERARCQDSYQMVWNLWHVCESVSHGYDPYLTPDIAYPQGANLVHHTLIAGYFPMTWLVKILTGSDPLYPVYANRIIIWLAFTLILWSSCVLLRELRATRLAAATLATAYAFSDFFTFHAHHLNHLAGFFIPLTAYFLVLCYRRWTNARLLAATLSASLAIYFTEFTLYLYLAAFGYGLWLCAFPATRKILFEKLGGIGKLRLGIALIIFLAIVAPFVTKFVNDKVRLPPLADSLKSSANPLGFIVPTPIDAPLYGDLFAPLAARITSGTGSQELFCGFTLLLCVVAGMFRQRNRYVWGAALLAAVFLLLSLGPHLHWLDRDTGIRTPYYWIKDVPPLRDSRTPARFFVMGLFWLMIVGAFGMTRLSQWLTARRDWRWSWAVGGLLFVWTVAEVYSPRPRQQPYAPPQELTRIVPGAVLNLPLTTGDGYGALLQIFHQQPISTGYLARVPVEDMPHFIALQRQFSKSSPDFCAEAARWGYKNIVIAPDSVFETYQLTMTPFELKNCELNVIDLRGTDTTTGLSGEAPNFGRFNRGDYPLYEPGTRLQLNTAAAESYLWYGWSGSREPDARWIERSYAAFGFTLAQTPAQDLVLRVKCAPFLVAGYLEQQTWRIELNGQLLTTLRVREGGMKEYAIRLPVAALREKNLLQFNLPDVDSPSFYGVGNDTRTLGLYVEWLEIDAADQPQ